MYYKITFVNFLFFLSVLITSFLGYFVWNKRNTAKAAFHFALMTFAISIWALFAGLEYSVLDFNAKVTFSKLSYIGIASTAPLWFTFVMEYTGFGKKFKTEIKRYLWIIPCVVILLAFTNEFHNLLWSKITLFTSSIEDGLVYQHGPIFYVNIIYIYTVLLAGILILVRYRRKALDIERSQIIFIIISLLIPTALNFIYATKGINPNGSIDFAPVAFSVSSILIILAIYRYKFISITTLAKERVFDYISSGTIVIDNNNKIIDYNKAAQLIFEHKLSKNLNITKLNFSKDFNVNNLFKTDRKVPFELYFEHNKKWYETRAERFSDSKDQLSGWLILFADITNLKQIQIELESKLNDISKLNKFMVDREIKMIELKKQAQLNNEEK